MSELSTPHDLWFRRSDPLSPRERLRKVVADLTRARRLQVLVDYGFGGLLAGLGLATVAVLIAGVMRLPWPPWEIAVAAVGSALTLALLAGWWKRPDALEVAIRADLNLRLKQRLSTAWEFTVVHDDGELAERLAVQAVNAGLPHRPGAVFPLRVNRWGRLAPLAATALLLASVIELDHVQAPAVHAPDARVVSEGERLGAFGRAMHERAAREKLPRSARQGAELERLGARMEGGTLSRSNALGELRRMDVSLDEERRQTLAEANGAAGDSPRGERRQGSPGASGLNPEALLDRMRRGALDRADLRALSRYLDDLARSGTPNEELEKALRQHRAGADDALKEILENLARTERARKEDWELGNAREQVRRARENLGEASATARARGPRAGIDWDEDEREDRAARGAERDDADARRSDETGRAAPRSSSQGDASSATDRLRSPYRPDPAQGGPVLKPPGQMREGESFSSHARLPPKSGRPKVDNVEMAREFAPQVEEVLSREQYPAHYKEFIRRYFLNLSRGVGVTPEQTGPAEKGGTQ